MENADPWQLFRDTAQTRIFSTPRAVAGSGDFYIRKCGLAGEMCRQLPEKARAAQHYPATTRLIVKIGSSSASATPPMMMPMMMIIAGSM